MTRIDARWILLLAVPLALAASPPVPPTPAPTTALLHARHFSVDQGFEFTWSKEHPQVREGTLVVVQADPALIRPRQTAEPVLYVGANPAWRVSPYNESGVIVAFVPAKVDLAREPVWFGRPALPERIGEADAALELQRARAAGIRPFGRTEVEPALVFASRTDLLRALHDLAVAHGAVAPASRD